PARLTELIGRESERAAARRLLQAGATRLVTLTGPGGVGKTRLALQVAGDLLPHLADGVTFVSLAPVSDPAMVMPTLAQALNLRQTGETSPLQRLKSHLQFSRALLVLDNFEQVHSAAPELAELLARCPELAVLVTSRARLPLSGEHELALQPLALPDPHDLAAFGSAPARLAAYGAVALFVQRAQAIQPSFQLDAGNAAAVADI